MRRIDRAALSAKGVGRVANGREVEILNIVDDHSRLLVASTARTVFKAADVAADLHVATAEHGRPER